MESNEEENEETKLQKVLQEIELDQSDIEKLKQQKFDDISEEAKEILQHSNITKEVIEEILIKSKQKPEDAAFEEHKEIRQSAEETENLEGPKRTSTEEIQEFEIKINPREEIVTFLRERSLSESLIKTLLQTGFTDEFSRFLKATGFIDEDIAELQKLWHLEARDREEIDSSASVVSSSDECLSSDGIYLKNIISKPLTCALREIISKKPFDPVEYLGHWLLNYKICEERDRRRREFELKLMIERERMKSRDVENDVASIERGEEEEFIDDWNYLNYE